MRGAIILLFLYAFISWTGKNLTSLPVITILSSHVCVSLPGRDLWHGSTDVYYYYYYYYYSHPHLQ